MNSVEALTEALALVRLRQRYWANKPAATPAVRAYSAVQEAKYAEVHETLVALRAFIDDRPKHPGLTCKQCGETDRCCEHCYHNKSRNAG